MTQENYIQTVKNLKDEILKSRYTIAKTANKELLLLYFKVGNIISEKVKIEKWGNKTIQKLSDDLQNELHGLRGFSYSNLKNMRMFYEEWNIYFDANLLEISIGSIQSSQLEDDKNTISQTVSGKLQNADYQRDVISQSVTDKLSKYFLNVGFSSHIEIISKSKNIDERVFYITKTAQEFWSVRTLKRHLKNKLFDKQGALPNNFEKTIISSSERQKALKNFSDHYLLDFIRISDEDEDDEKLLAK